MSILVRLFGRGSGVSPEDREAALSFLVRLNALRAVQDDAAAGYNGTLAKYGGSLTSGTEGLRQVALSARQMAEANRSIARQYSSIGPIPDVAGPCYFAWSNCWLLLEEWSSRAAAAYEGMYEGARPPAAEIQKLLVSSEQAREAATREEARLLRRLRLTAEEARSLIREGERRAQAEGGNE